MGTSDGEEGPDTPPQELKDVIDKTVGYVLKNGVSFEDRLKNNATSKDKFAFLQEDHPYHGYYKWKLEDGGDAGEVKPGIKPTEGEKVEVLTKEPTPFAFITRIPPVSPLDLDIIKLTSLFVARNGDKFAEKLLAYQKAQNNGVQFGFINKNHSLHKLYREYVKQYHIVLSLHDPQSVTKEGKAVKERLENSEKLFENAFNRAQYAKQHKQKVENKKRLEEQKQLEYASIDWQDFTFVQKIEFDAIDEVREMSLPVTRDELIYRSLESKAQGLELPEAVPEAVPPPVAPLKNNAQDTQPPLNTVPANEQAIPKGMKIKSAGTSRLKNKPVASKNGTVSEEESIKCPITGELIPKSKFDTHLKVLLRDPRYKEQQENFVKKNFSYASNLTTEQVYDNIKRLVRKREGSPLGENVKPKKIQPGPP